MHWTLILLLTFYTNNTLWPDKVSGTQRQSLASFETRELCETERKRLQPHLPPDLQLLCGQTDLPAGIKEHARPQGMFDCLNCSSEDQ